MKPWPLSEHNNFGLLGENIVSQPFKRTVDLSNHTLVETENAFFFLLEVQFIHLNYTGVSSSFFWK